MEDGVSHLHQGDTELATFFGQSSFSAHVVAHERNVVKVDNDVDLTLLGRLAVASRPAPARCSTV